MPSPAMRRRLRRLQGRKYDLVHVFRLYMLPIASAIVGDPAGIPLQLDLDDWESKTRLAIAAIAGSGRSELAAQLRAEASALADEERRRLPRMKRIFVCSQQDASALSAHYGLTNVFPVNNAVKVPASFPRSGGDALRDFLFIGALGYFPNQDAVLFLLDEVLPKLRASAAIPFRVVIAGAAATPALRKRFRAEERLEWIDSPEQVEPLYRNALAALAPIRAGGGSRIKALEAFAQGRPLVATSAAVEGLDVAAGVHYIQANTAEEWVAALRQLLESPSEAMRIAESAFEWVRQHSFDATVDRIASIVR
jgi:polysaccharide biosynthesis protein PslH